jgi:chemotaxis protein CheD
MKQASTRKNHAINPGPPRRLPGFEAIQHTWDAVHRMYAARILPGEYYVSCDREIIVTTLGSCVSACVRDRKTGIGGMNHFMLPDDNGSIKRDSACTTTATRYGCFAMKHLIDTILANGGSMENLEIKLFGGSNIMRSMTDVGIRNISFVRHYLGNDNFQVHSEDLGGSHPRKVMYFPFSGRVLVRKIPIQRRQTDEIVRQEAQYRDSLTDMPA